MQYTGLRDFMTQLEKMGELKRIHQPISPVLEMTEIGDRTLRKGGPALLYENVVHAGKKYDYPVLANLFGTPRRVALGMGAQDVSELRAIGQLLSNLKEPQPPAGLKEIGKLGEMAKAVWDMRPKMEKHAAVHEIILEGDDVDLTQLPIQHCWPGDIAPLLSWGLVVTKGPHKARQNLGIYRQQVLGRNKLIMRWLAHRGGALDFRDHCLAHPNTPFPISVVLGCDPATILGAVTPVPDTLSEYQFAGLLRHGRTVLTKCIGNDLTVPANAEIVLEGVLHPNETALEGPFGDHTGYYNEQETFPVFTVERMRELYQNTSCLLRQLGLRGIHMQRRDGTLGMPEAAPFDRIIVTAGGPEVPRPLVEQLDEGGIMLIPVGAKPRTQRLVRVRKEQGRVSSDDLGPVVFVDLVGDHGW